MASDGSSQDENEPSSLGARVHELRRARNQSLSALAKAAGTSASFISQLERGRSSASVATLQRIADALAVSLADLFDASRPVPLAVLRYSERPLLASEPGVRRHLLTGRPMRHLQVHQEELEPAASAERRDPGGDSQEMLVVQQGAVTLQIAGAAYDLASGDSVEYSTAMPYTLVNSGDETAIVLRIISPPAPDEAILPPVEG